MGREMQNASKTGDLDEFANAGKHWQVVWLSYRAMFLSTYISRISFFRLRTIRYRTRRNLVNGKSPFSILQGALFQFRIFSLQDISRLVI